MIEMTSGIRRAMVAFCMAMSASAAFAAGPIEPVDADPGREADFYVDVYPLLESKCLACHNRTVHENDLVLEDLASILKGGGGGPAVVAGQPEASLLFKACARQGDSPMPPLPNKVGAVAVTPKELGRLKRWIAEGAKPGKANPSAAAIGWQALPTGLVASYALALSPEERFVAVSRANTIHIEDLVTQTEVAELGDPLLKTVRTPEGRPLYERNVAHLDIVQSLAFSPDGDWLASGGYREIKLWQRQRNVILARKEWDKPVVAVVPMSDDLLLLGLDDGSLKIWNSESPDDAPTMGALAGLSALALSADRMTAFAATREGVVSLWSLPDRRKRYEFTTGSTVTALCVVGERTLVTGHADGAVRVWECPAEAPSSPLMAVKEWPATNSACVEIAPMGDGSQLRVALADGRVLDLKRSEDAAKDAHKFAEAIRGAALSPVDERVLAIDANGRTARLAGKGQAVAMALSSTPAMVTRQKRLAGDRTVAESQVNIASAATKAAEKESTERAEFQSKSEGAKTTAEKTLADAQAKVDELDKTLAQAKAALTEKPDDEAAKKAVTDAEAALTKPREALKAASEGLTAADRTVRFSLQAAQAARAEVVKRQSIQSEAEKRLAEVIAAIAKANEEQAASTVEIRSAALSADGRFAATGTSDGSIHLWSTRGQWLETLRGSSAVTAVRFVGTSLASASEDRSITLWDLRPQWKLAAVLGVKPESRLDVRESPLVDRVLALAFSPDGRLLASGGGEPSRSGELLLWDVENLSVHREFRELHSDTVTSLAFNRSGQFLATGSADKFMKVTDVGTNQFVKGYEGHTGHVLGVTWKADSSSLASAGADGAVKVWSTETGEQRKSIPASTGQETSLTWIALSDQVAATNSKGQCQVLEAESGKTAKTIAVQNGYVYAVGATADGERIFTSGEDGVLRVWSAKTGAVEMEFKPAATGKTGIQ